MNRILEEIIIAFIPQYIKDKGNCTLVYTKDNEPIVLEMNIRTFIKNLCKHYMIDLAETRKRYKKMILYPNMMPIPLSKNDIFIPFKTRIPVARNDGSLGYINMNYIKKISEGNGTTNIHIEGNTCLEVFSTVDTANKHMKDGTIVRNCFIERSSTRVAEDNVVYVRNDGRTPIIIIYEK